MAEPTHERPQNFNYMFQLSNQNRLLLGAAAVILLAVGISLIFGAIFRFCDNRKIEKHETNINAATETVETDEKKVEEMKMEAAETKGEVKVLKEIVKENNVEVNQKIQNRRKSTAHRQRVRRNPVRNVNGTELNRILNEADSNANP